MSQVARWSSGQVAKSVGRAVVLGGVVISCAFGQEWRAGVAKAAITPKESIWMAGFGSRTKPSEGVRQDIYVKALALEDRDKRIFVILTADLVGVERATSDEVAKRCGLPRERLLLSFSHTHSAPVTTALLGKPGYRLDERNTEVLRRYLPGVLDKMAAVVSRAKQDLSPATVSFGQGVAGFAVNRRHAGNRSWPGPVDQDVPVLAVRAPDGKLRAVIAGYACHATVLSDYKISGDWPGYFKEDFEKANPGVEAMFVAGCGADANALPRSSEELARTYGHIFSTAVGLVVRGNMTKLSGPIQGVFDIVTLPIAPYSREKLEAELKSDNPTHRNNAADQLKILEGGGKLEAAYPYPIEVWRFGDKLNWIVLSSEVVVDYSLRLKSQYGAKTTWVSAYANDYCGYIPSLRVLKEGGYEGGEAMAAQGHPGPWGEAVEERIAGKVREMVGKKE